MSIDVAVLRTKLIADIKQYSAGLTKASAQAKAFEKATGASAKKIRSQFARDVFAHQRAGLSKFVGQMKMATTVAVGLGTAIGVKLVKDGIKLNAQWESINASFRTFLGSSKNATKFVEQLRRVSQKSPLRLTEYAEAARMLMGFGVETKKVIPLLAALNTAIVASGQGSEEMMSVVRALGQMQAKGKASAEELNQLAEVGVPVNKILQKELGLTGEQVANIGKEGIKSEKALEAIATGWRKQFGGAFKDAQMTATVQFATLQKNWEQTLRLMTAPLFEELQQKWLPAFNKTATDIIAIWQRKGLTPEDKFARARDSIMRNFGPLFDEIGELIKKAELGDKAIDALNAAIPKVAEWGAKAAIKAAEMFGKAFIKSHGITRLALGAWAVQKFVGLSNAFRLVGARSGMEFSAGMTSTMAGGGAAGGGAAAGGMAGALTGRFKRLTNVARVAGRVVVGAALVNGIIEAIGTEGGLGDRLQGALAGVSFGIIPNAVVERAKETQRLTDEIANAQIEMLPVLKEKARFMEEANVLSEDQLKLIERQTQERQTQLTKIETMTQAQTAGIEMARSVIANEGRVTKSVQRMIDGMDKLEPAAREKTKNAMLSAIRTAEKYGELPDGTANKIAKSFSESYRVAKIDATNEIRKMRANVVKVTEDTGEKGKKSVREWRTAHGQEIKRLVSMHSGQMDDYVEITREAYGKVKTSTNKILKAFGAKPVKLSLEAGGGKQRGGYVEAAGGFLAGTGRQDKVPVMAAPGEAFLTRHQGSVVDQSLRATQGFGLSGLFSRLPKKHAMARGGMVTGDTDYMPAVGTALERMAKAKKTHIFVQEGRRTIAEQAARYARYLAGGNLAAKPTANAPHVRGVAADITPGREVFGGAAGRFGLGFTVPSEGWHIELMGAVGRAIEGIPTEIGIPKIGGPAGALKDLANAAVGKVVGAANKYISKQPVGLTGETGPKIKGPRKFSGKVSVFGPPTEPAGPTASGASSAAPGIALLNQPTLGKMFRTRLGGRRARLRQTDIGPAAWTDRIIDYTGAAAQQMGIDPMKFPTDSWGTAELMARGGLVGFQGGGRADEKIRGPKPKVKRSGKTKVTPFRKKFKKPKRIIEHLKRAFYHQDPVALKKAVESRDNLADIASGMYGNMARQFNLTDEEFILTDKEGNEILNRLPVPSGIAGGLPLQQWVEQNMGVMGHPGMADPVTGQLTRGIPQYVAEQLQLADIKNRERGELVEQTNAVHAVRAALEKGIAERVRRMEAINAEVEKNNNKIDDLREKRKRSSRKRKKLKGKKNRGRRRSLGKQIDRYTERIAGIKKTNSTLVGEASEVSGSISTWRGDDETYVKMLSPTGVPAAISSIGLDIAEIYKDIGQATGTVARPPEAPDVSAAEAERIRLLEQLNKELAQKLVVSQAQYKVFQGFPGLQAGTPEVKRGGLFELHPGEAVIPEEFNPLKHGGGGAGSVVINFSGDAAPIMKQLIQTAEIVVDGKKAEIVEDVSRSIGESVGLGNQSAGKTAITAVYS